MALAAPQQITNAGVVPGMNAPTLSDSFTWPSTDPAYVRMRVKNASAASITATITSEANASDGLTTSNKQVSVAAGAEKEFKISQVFRASDDTVAVAFSDVTSVTAGVFYE